MAAGHCSDTMPCRSTATVPWMSVEAVIFDWAGTLSRHVDIDLTLLWRTAARVIDPEREVQLAAQLRQIEHAHWERARTTHQSWTLADMLRAAEEQLGLAVEAATIEDAARLHLEAWTPFIVHDPEAAPVLRALRSRGIRTGLLSNTHWPRVFHEQLLERDGLASLLSIRMYSCELPFVKPHPSAFRAALDALGVSEPERSMFVGDRLYDDIFGSQSIGMRGVHRLNPSLATYDVEPYASIRALPELLALID